MGLFRNMRLANGKIANYDEEKGIHYGVIHQNEVDPYAIEYIYDKGVDIYYEDALADLKKRIADTLDDGVGDTDDNVVEALRAQLRNESDCFAEGLIDVVKPCLQDVAEAKQEAEDYIDADFGQYYKNDCGVFQFDDDGYKISYSTDSGYIMVIDSPYYTMAHHCSPCYPNAGDLGTPGSLRTYCLGIDWFEEAKPPYDVYDVETNELVYKHKEEENV